MSWHLNNIDNGSDYVGFVTPGGQADQVLKLDNINGENLTEKDSLVIMCGTNDVARNDSGELMNKMNAFIKNVKNKRVVLIDQPNRYDLADRSCVNLETKKINTTLKKLTEQFENVILVEASKASRVMHARQGLHFNSRGHWLAKSIKEVVKAQYINIEKCGYRALPVIKGSLKESNQYHLARKCCQETPHLWNTARYRIKEDTHPTQTK